MSEVHIYLIRFSGCNRLLIPHLILFPPFVFPPAGAVDKIVLPEGIQTVQFRCMDGITGTAESLGRVMVIFI